MIAVMPSLLEPPSAEARRMLEIIAEGWSEAQERWPVWQYVTLRLGAEGHDADGIYLGMPSWKYSYRSTFRFESGVVPSQGDRVGLTVHGLFHVQQQATAPLLNAFIHILRAAVRAQSEAVPSPVMMQPILYPVSDLLQKYTLLGTRPPTDIQLVEMLQHEPATWTGVTTPTSHGSASWDLAQPRLQDYTGVESVEDYLARLEALVGVDERDTTNVILSPLALPDAFDHLDLAWRLLMRKRLVRLPRAGIAAQLTQPVTSVEEFRSRCSALTDLLSNMDVPLGELAADSKSLARLQEFFKAQLGDEGLDAVAAVRTLHQVAAVRNAQQHTGSAIRYDRDWVALGLPRFGSDWAGAWHRVTVLTAEALAIIREALMRLVDGTT